MMQNEERIKEMLAAASMFDASVGGYVLVALISFAVAVAFTLLCIRWKQKTDQRDGPAVETDRRDSSAAITDHRDSYTVKTDTRDNSSVINDPQGESMTADGVQSVNRKID